MKNLNCTMTERQLNLLALILFEGGYSYDEAAFTLGVSREDVVTHTLNAIKERMDGLYPPISHSNVEMAKTDPERGKLRELIDKGP